MGILQAKFGIPTYTLHSMRQQKERVANLVMFNNVMFNNVMFNNVYNKVLVANNVASKGLDISEFNLEVNHNIPSGKLI